MSLLMMFSSWCLNSPWWLTDYNWGCHLVMPIALWWSTRAQYCFLIKAAYSIGTRITFITFTEFILLRYTQMSTSYIKEMPPIIFKTFYLKPQMHECIKSGANPINCPGPREMPLLLHDICFISLKRSESILTWLGNVLNTVKQTLQSHHCSCENIPYIFRPRKQWNRTPIHSCVFCSTFNKLGIWATFLNTW